MLGTSVWLAQGNGTTIAQFGIGENATGTPTGRNVANTSIEAAIRRLGYVSAAGAGSSAGTRHGILQLFRSANAPFGFIYRARFTIAAVQANMRWFVGVTGSAAVIGNVNPSTLTDIAGFGIDSGQTTVRRLRNDNAGGATATDLGANFPATTAGVVYDVHVQGLSTGIVLRIQRLDVAQDSSASIAADIPADTTLLSPQIWINNGTTAAAVAIDVSLQAIDCARPF